MPNRCKACTHEKRLEIDRTCVRGKTNREIAEAYGLSVTGVDRHRKHCLTRQLLKASEIKEVAAADTLLGDIRSLKDRAVSILDQAESGKELDTALRAIREVRGCIELLAKVTGELQDGPTVNVLVSAEWVTIQNNVLNALEPYPDARIAVAGALKTIEGVANAA
jgi:hypothetical protein